MCMTSAGEAYLPVHHTHMAQHAKKLARNLQVTHLREWREHRDYSLEEAAEEFGMTHGQLSRIERGKSPYSQRLLENAAVLYRCTVIDLLSRAPDEAESLFAAYAELDEAGRQQAARLIAAIKPPKS